MTAGRKDGAAEAAQDGVADQAAGWLLRMRQHPDDSALRRELDAWIAASDRHAAAWRAAELMWRLSGAVGPARPSHVAAGAAQRWRGAWLGLVGLAVAACLAVFLVPALYQRWQADHVTATGEIRMVDLADGSRVELDSASAFAIDFTPSRRETRLLAGQAFFAVAPNPDRPFVVRAGEVEITVTGTAFDVRLGRGQVAVEVQSGTVRVAYPDDGAGSGNAVLRPGQRLIWGAGGMGAMVQDAVPEQMASWRRGRLLVTGATIGDLVAEIGRYRPGLVVLTDDDLALRRVTGVFDLRDPLRALKTVVEPHAGRVREITPWLVVVSGR